MLLLCLPAAAEAFTTGKPLSLVVTQYQQRHHGNTIPGRAPVDVFYVDDESSEEHTVLTSIITKDPLQEDQGEFPELVNELMIERSLDELEERGKLLNDQLFSTASSALPLQETAATTFTKSSPQEPLPPLSEKDIPAIPTFPDYRKFALPCFGLLLSGPLLSLVDTAFVGLASTNSMELAALGPATTLFDCLTWLLSFLNVATTNLYSSALAKNSQHEAEGVVRTGSRVGLTIGVGVMAILIVFCQPILSGYMGTYYSSVLCVSLYQD